MEGRHSWIPAKLTDQKFYILWENESNNETELAGEKVSVKEFVHTPIAKMPPSVYNDQYSKASIQWLEWMAHVNNITIQHALNTGENPYQAHVTSKMVIVKKQTQHLSTMAA